MAAPLLPVDPEVRIPAAVKAASARADEVHKEAYTPAPGNPEGNQPAEPKSADAPVDPPAPVAADPKPADAPAPDARPARRRRAQSPAPEPAPAPVEENWEHRYNSMKGRFDQSQHENRTLRGQMGDMAERLQRLETQLTQREPAPPKPQPQPARLVTAEEEREYGSELLDVVGRRAKEQLSPEIAAIMSRMSELEGRLTNVGQSVEQDARARMHADLDRAVPDWRAINSEPEFVNWLQLADSYSGVMRHTLLKQAYERNETPRVLAFFKGFLAEEAALAPAGDPPAPATPPTPGGDQEKPTLESLAAPGRAKSAASGSAPAEKPTFSRADVSKFYANLAAGRYNGREKEAQALEAKIIAAGREGRITN